MTIEGADVDRAAWLAAGSVDIEPRHPGHDCGPAIDRVMMHRAGGQQMYSSAQYQ
jgi:hypothetical protein